MGRWYRGVLLGGCVMATSGCGGEAPASASMPAGGESPGGEPKAEPKAEPPRCPEPRVSLADRMAPTLTAACEQAAVDPMRLDSALDLVLTGTWTGEYVSDAFGSSPTRFEASVLTTGGVVSGTTTEPNTFGPYGYAELQADLAGEAYATRQVVLLKTYRTATVTHSVLYVGRLDAAGKRVEGRWRLGSGQGTFWLEKS